MKENRYTCPFCKAARMRVETSRRVPDSDTQEQRLRCPQCDRTRTITVPRADIFPRQKSSTLEQIKPDVLAKVRKIQKRKRR